MTQGKNHIHCLYCGQKIGFRQKTGKTWHWFLTEPASPAGGPDFKCDNCRQTKQRATKRETDAKARTTTENTAKGRVE